jgi:hypothetical protein
MGGSEQCLVRLGSEPFFGFGLGSFDLTTNFVWGSGNELPWQWAKATVYSKIPKLIIVV